MGEFTECVLNGPTPAVTARLRLSYGRLFHSEQMRHTGRLFGLTPRQLAVAIMLCKGVPLHRLDAHFGCKVGTLAAHRRRIYDKLGVHCVEQLILKFILASGLLLTEEDRELIQHRPETARVEDE